MEVRVVGHGPNKLSTKVFFSDESGFEVASVIVMGKEDAILIDTQWTLSNAHRVIAEVLETGKKLKYIFLSHAHPDHYFGTGHIAEAFPDAKVVALADTAEMVNEQFFGKIEHWEGVIGSHNVARKEVPVEVLEDHYLELEGERLEIIPNVVGDLVYNTMVWIPSIKTLYGSDVLFNQAHPFTCEVTAEERKEWIQALDDIEKMGAEVIIPGHQKPGMPFDLSSVYFTRDYLIANDEELENTEDVAGFYYNMVQRFPDANLFISIEMNANVFKGGRDWNWRAIE
ncbi:MBL fold metallo-hydrolase [Alkalibacter rhizosphaerae]|uniref:MBL fold metallo-hydrolase n=1 Tax=Alkalibacter rhizosphaerae TaxID=2815577 RepID=A0A975AHQ3_9FIRM|nr:MBL fold metallo-hydrolase [Alkalibacter rhizosphaerae]QSX08258.1 MBL fold metallo-hydrolase [Alkalibacter rhizosphaerae]